MPGTTCHECGGRKYCIMCEGSGRDRDYFGIGQCRHCRGHGYCPICRGEGHFDIGEHERVHYSGGSDETGDCDADDAVHGQQDGDLSGWSLCDGGPRPGC